MSLLSRIKQHFMAPGSGLGLGIFRIVYSLVMLAEVLELLYFHDLIYGEVPGDTWHVDNHFQVLLLVSAGRFLLVSSPITADEHYGTVS